MGYWLLFQQPIKDLFAFIKYMFGFIKNKEGEIVWEKVDFQDE